MLDIIDKNGKVVAVVMDDGSIVVKTKPTDDINQLVKEQLDRENKKRKR